VASRANVPPFHVMDLLAAADARRRSHGDVLDLVAGQPSTPAPAPVREAARRALDESLLGYTVASGVAELREAIAGHHRSWHGIDVTRDDVVVSTLPAVAADAVAETVPQVHHGILLDVGYAGWPTPPARAAAAAGMTVVSGLDMLVHQAAQQFRLFTGHEAPVEAMAAAGRAALAAR